jgi:transcriptional regulator with XRE-family HTH domain
MPESTPRAAGIQPPRGTAFVSDVLAGNLRLYRMLHDGSKQAYVADRMEQDHVATRMRLLGHTTWSRVTVSEVERGLRNVTVPELVSLAVVLGATIEQLLDTRGPLSRSGSRLLLGNAVEPFKDLAVEPQHVTGLVCNHKVHAQPEWDGTSALRTIKYVDGRPDLTDVGPDGAP